MATAAGASRGISISRIRRVGGTKAQPAKINVDDLFAVNRDVERVRVRVQERILNQPVDQRMQASRRAGRRYSQGDFLDIGGKV